MERELRITKETLNLIINMQHLILSEVLNNNTLITNKVKNSLHIVCIKNLHLLFKLG